MASTAKKTKKSKINWEKVALVSKTIIICGLIAGAVVYHILAIRNAEKRAYLEGAKDFKQVEQGR